MSGEFSYCADVPGAMLAGVDQDLTPGLSAIIIILFYSLSQHPQLLQPNETIVNWEWLIAGSTLKGHHAAHCATCCRALMAVRLPSFRSGSSFTSVRI